MNEQCLVRQRCPFKPDLTKSTRAPGVTAAAVQSTDEADPIAVAERASSRLYDAAVAQQRKVIPILISAALIALLISPAR
jgi:hypothetical protein